MFPFEIRREVNRKEPRVMALSAGKTTWS